MEKTPSCSRGLQPGLVRAGVGVVRGIEFTRIGPIGGIRFPLELFSVLVFGLSIISSSRSLVAVMTWTMSLAVVSSGSDNNDNNNNSEPICLVQPATFPLDCRNSTGSPVPGA